MHALSFLLRIAALAIVLAMPTTAVVAEADTVGVVGKVENEAEIVSPSRTVAAVNGAPVHMGDELRTGAGARLLVTFRDDTALILGENASVTIDAYVFNPDLSVGKAILEATRGAFRFATGQIKDLKQKQVQIATPVATIGVRGTEFWGGLIDENYGVLLLEGEVAVSNAAGTVILSATGQGTNIASSATAPGTPAVWPKDKVARAVATVALH